MVTDSPWYYRHCNIYSPSLNSIGGVLHIPIGAQDVILYCICKDSYVAVGPTYWFFNDQQLETQMNGSNPYYRNNVPAPLIIPLFAASHNGSYSCSGVFHVIENDTIKLVSSGIIICK